MISKARGVYVDCSPQKARLVVDLIRGRSAEEALNILRYTRKRVAANVLKILRSATANAESNPEKPVDVEDLYVSTIFVDGASTRFRRRMMPAPMGRAFRFVKRQSHITIGLDVRES